jgi:hypothetical protein
MRDRCIVKGLEQNIMGPGFPGGLAEMLYS